MIRLHVCRIDYTETSTLSVLVVNGSFWGYALEDRCRPAGVKVAGGTCIPAGTYRLRVTFSDRFGRWMSELMDVPGFRGIRIHGGNTHVDTKGCLLVAANRPSRERIQGSLESRLSAFLRSRIEAVPGESEAGFWSRLPEAWCTVQDGPLAPLSTEEKKGN